MTEAYSRYRQLENDLTVFRLTHPPGSEEEEPILEEMTIAWYNLSDEEMAILNSEGPVSFSQ